MSPSELWNVMTPESRSKGLRLYFIFKLGQFIPVGAAFKPLADQDPGFISAHEKRVQGLSQPWRG